MPFLKCRQHGKPRSRILENLAHKQGLRHAIFYPKNYYVGEWNQSKKEGLGVMLTKKKRHYRGFWSKNLPHGFGEAAFEDEDKVLTLEYRGNWEYGQYSGYGERHYRNHGYYRGYFKNSKRLGYGQMWYPSGCFYDGDWLNDLRHGLGMYVYKNGNRYEGNWKNGLKHGDGRYFNLDAGLMQQGVWVEDICVVSFVVNIPFRQTAIHPTPYPIQENELEDCEDVYKLQKEVVMLKMEQPLIDQETSGSSLLDESNARISLSESFMGEENISADYS